MRLSSVTRTEATHLTPLGRGFVIEPLWNHESGVLVPTT